jgi:hypothetical protein
LGRSTGENRGGHKIPSRSDFPYSQQYQSVWLAAEESCSVSAILAIDPGIHMGWALLRGNRILINRLVELASGSSL